MNMEKICIVGANFGTGNLGVGALTMGAIKCVNYAYPQARIFIMDYAAQKEIYRCRVNHREIEVPLVNIRYSWKLFLMNNIVVLLFLALVLRATGQGKVSSFILRRNQWLRQLKEADLVASVAGGDSFSDLYGIGRFIYVTLPQVLALLLDRKLFIMPQTIGPFSRRFTRFAARKVMQHAHRIHSRDQAGIEETMRLLKNGRGSGELRFCYDMGFILDPVRPGNGALPALERVRGNHSVVIGVNISGLLLMGGYDRRNMFGLKADYAELICAILARLLSRADTAVILVPHVYGGHAESDDAAIAKLNTGLCGVYPERLFPVTGVYDQNEIKYIIGMCDHFIGSRMHACIAAVSQAIPTVSVAYSKKFVGVMKSIGMENACVDPRHEDIEAILAKIEISLSRRSEIRADLEKRMPQIKQRVLELFLQ